MIDAFGTAHRAHASTALSADYFPNDKMFGYVMENELKAIDGIMLNPERPFCAILGGSKVSTKITIIENLLEKVDVLVLGGGMTYTFAAAEGGKVGNSICEPDQFQTALDILAKAKEKGVKVVMSPDALSADAFSADANTNVAPANNIPDGWEGVDIADEGKKVFREEILKCKTILWNGPVGVFEIDKFATGSKEVALAIEFEGVPGAAADSIVCDIAPKTVRLNGEADVLASIDKLVLATLHVDDLGLHQQNSYVVTPPDGTWLVNGNEVATADIPLDGISETTLTVTDLSFTDLPAGLYAVVPEGGLTVRLWGLSEEIEAITAENLRATADMSTVTGQGSFTVPVTVTVSGFSDVTVRGT